MALAFVGNGVTQTPLNERLAHLERIQREWTAALAALEGSDVELARSIVDALADLETLIRRVQQQASG